MPHLVVLVASPGGQRRLLEETLKRFSDPGTEVLSAREGETWVSLLADNLSGGLFDDRRIVVVDRAQDLGPVPSSCASLLEPPGASCTLVLLYEQDPGKALPGELRDRITRVESRPLPRFGRERTDWIEGIAREEGVRLAPGALALLSEAFEDPEELAMEVRKLALLGPEAGEEQVRRLCLGDGNRLLVQFLDSLCRGQGVAALACLEGLRRRDEVIPVLAALHNRFRLAWWGARFPRRSGQVERLLKARPYAWKLAQQAAGRYGPRALTVFVGELVGLNLREKTGRGSGWAGVELAVQGLLRATKNEGPLGHPSSMASERRGYGGG